MLVFTDAQMDVWRQQRLNAFAKELADRARLVHRALCEEISQPALEARMANAVEAAHDLGLTNRDQCERFADLSMVFGAGFERVEEWAVTIFSRPDDPAERLRDAEASAVFLIREATP